MNNTGELGEDSAYEDQFYEVAETSTIEAQGDIEQLAPLRDQDRFLPIANVSKIMKRSVPETGKIAKEAKETMQECISEFISFITSEAAERCQQEKRKTINGEDLLFAMNTLGFDNYIEPLKVFLTKYREINKMENIDSFDDMFTEQTSSIQQTMTLVAGLPSEQSLLVPETSSLLQTVVSGTDGTPTTIYVPYSAPTEQPFQQVTYVNGSQSQQICDTSEL